MANSLDDVVSQLDALGLSAPNDLEKAFGKTVRWRPTCEKKPKKSAWIRLTEWTSPKTGKVYIFGRFGWRSEKWDVQSVGANWSPEDRAAAMEARKAAEKAERIEREREAALAAEKARRMWDKARDADQGPRHPYLERKGVAPFGLRVGFNQRLLVPLRDLENKLHGLQYISPEGEKIFGTSTAKEGKFHLIGEVVEGQPIAFAEGYATGATVHMAVGWPVVVCFDAGNLDVVMAAWRKLYPDAAMIVMGDDDRHLMRRLVDRLADLGIHATEHELADMAEQEWSLPDGRAVALKAGWSKDTSGVMCIKGHIVVDGMPRLLSLENAGRRAAVAAVRKHKAAALLPAFAAQDSSGTDWNDLHCEEGLEATRKLIQSLLAGLDEGKKSAATDAPQGGGKKGEPPKDLSFIDRFTLIYGTTTVWDEEERAIIRLESMKAAFGKTVDWWLGHGERRMVSQQNVVFDPTGRIAKPGTHVNLFDKLPVDLDQEGDCSLIIRHLYNVCGEDDQLMHWVTCWLALPLQRLGTKMRTSLIIHGRMEGTGKSLMMDIMRRIYGRYSRSITQTQLQSEFNGWQSGMLFCVAEEVVSASERKNLKNLIQNMITNEVIQVNEKNMPVREEASYANFVFLSNEQLPMLLNETDRRYTVIQVERRHEPDYFRAIGEQMDNGGVAAFYRWLMNYDIGDFTQYTLPFETKARVHLITLGMSPDQRFMLFWTKGLAGVPFVTAPARDLYTAFRSWCRINGERFIASSTQFGRTASEFLERQNAPPKKIKRFDAYLPGQIDKDDMNLTHSQQSMVYFVPPAMQRLEPGGPVVEGDAATEDPLQPEVYNRRIRQFQSKLASLIDQARRAF